MLNSISSVFLDSFYLNDVLKIAFQPYFVQFFLIISKLCILIFTSAIATAAVFLIEPGEIGVKTICLPLMIYKSQ